MLAIVCAARWVARALAGDTGPGRAPAPAPAPLPPVPKAQARAEADAALLARFGLAGGELALPMRCRANALAEQGMRDPLPAAVLAALPADLADALAAELRRREWPGAGSGGGAVCGDDWLSSGSSSDDGGGDDENHADHVAGRARDGAGQPTGPPPLVQRVSDGWHEGYRVAVPPALAPKYGAALFLRMWRAQLPYFHLGHPISRDGELRAQALAQSAGLPTATPLPGRGAAAAAATPGSSAPGGAAGLAAGSCTRPDGSVAEFCCYYWVDHVKRRQLAAMQRHGTAAAVGAAGTGNTGTGSGTGDTGAADALHAHVVRAMTGRFPARADSTGAGAGAAKAPGTTTPGAGAGAANAGPTSSKKPAKAGEAAPARDRRDGVHLQETAVVLALMARLHGNSPTRAASEPLAHFASVEEHIDYLASVAARAGCNVVSPTSPHTL